LYRVRGLRGTAAGLKGTGSHHITLTDTVVSEANFFNLANGVPCLQGPLYQAVLPLLPLMLGAVSVGVAEGALDELVELANTGRRQLQAAEPMRDSETFQGELGRIAAELRAARAFLQVQAASHWHHDCYWETSCFVVRDRFAADQDSHFHRMLLTDCMGGRDD
jgi:indole-3-acetate monooxygenase